MEGIQEMTIKLELSKDGKSIISIKGIKELGVAASLGLLEMAKDNIKDSIFRNNKVDSQPTNDPQPYIRGIHRLAKYLGISPTMAQKLKNEGIFGCFQYDKTVLFEKQKVKEALNNYNKK